LKRFDLFWSFSSAEIGELIANIEAAEVRPNGRH
jgi:hypothetical protein